MSENNEKELPEEHRPHLVKTIVSEEQRRKAQEQMRKINIKD